MKNSSLNNLVLGLSAIVVCGSALAADKATVTITGSVAPGASISATAADRLSEDQMVNGVTDLAVSTINEKCNKKAGYTVTLESREAMTWSINQARLRGLTKENVDVVNYTIKYNGSEVKLGNAGVNGRALVTDATDKTGGSGVDKKLAISIPGGQNPSSDTYEDVVTLTIALK